MSCEPDKNRNYLTWNRINGNSCLMLFINDRGIYGVETNGDPIYQGQKGFMTLLKQCTSVLSTGDAARETNYYASIHGVKNDL
jgi:hypothetical protein